MSDIEMSLIIKDIVGSKGYHVYKMWSEKKEDIGTIVDRLNEKINEVPGQTKIETTEKPLFVQQQFEF